MNDLFFRANRDKLRFSSSTGVFGGERTTEQLFDMNMDSLDRLQMEYNEILGNAPKVKSLLTAKKPKNPILKLKFNVVKEVLLYKIEKNEAATNKLAENEKKQKLLAQWERIQNKEIEEMSKEDFLKKFGKELGLKS